MCTIIKTNDVNDLLFDVQKIAEDRWASNSDHNFNVVVFPDEYPDGYKVNSVSERYNLVDNQMFVQIEETLKANNVDFEVQYEIRDYGTYEANYILKSRDGESLGIQIASGDVVYPRLNVRKSFNSLVKYAFLFGFYRVVCSNGLVIPVEELSHLNFNYKGKHTKKLSESIETLIEKIEMFMDYMERTKVVDNMKKLVNNTYVSDFAERIEEVMNATKLPISTRGRKPKDGSERKENVEAIIAIAKRESAQLDQPMNDWLIYNAINNWLYNTNKKTNEVREEIDQKVIAYMLSN